MECRRKLNNANSGMTSLQVLPESCRKRAGNGKLHMAERRNGWYRKGLTKIYGGGGKISS